MSVTGIGPKKAISVDL